MSEAITDVIGLIKKHEGYQEFPYKDSRGILTVWYGHNLEAKPLCPEATAALQTAASAQLQSDLSSALQWCESQAWYSSLNPPRQAVVVDMVYNIGIEGFSQFHHLIGCLAAGDYAGASAQMLSSLWAQQVPNRAKEDSAIMLQGTFLPATNTPD
jgi:lysozyme